MSIVDKLKQWGKRQSFQPGPLAILFNPFYFLRVGLFRQVRSKANELNGIMLDFGCGRKPYKNLFNVKQHIGVDIEQSGHPHELSEVDVFYDGKTIPFEDGYFDSVFCSEVFEHLFEPDLIVKEINRVTKKGGKMLITVPFVWNDHEVPFDYGRYSTYGIKYLLEKNGFEILSTDKSTNFVETLFQLWMLYWFHLLRTKSPVINAITNLIFIAPICILGLAISSLLPRRVDLYHNSIVLARKK